MKLAIAVAGYNRVEYGSQCFRSLAGNQESADYPIYFYADGKSRAPADAQLKSASEAGLKDVILRHAGAQLGCGRNLIRLRRDLFDKEGFDYVLVIEDDVVLPKHYIRLITRLMKWCELNYTDVGVASNFNWHCKSAPTSSIELSQVVGGNTNWVSYLMPRTTWDKIKGALLHYETTFLGGRPYRSRPSDPIRAYFSSLLASALDPIGDKPFPTEASTWFVERPVRWTGATGQDACTAAAMYNNGLCKVATHINRLKYIGENGEHSNPAKFRQGQFDKIYYQQYKEDESLSDFSPRKYE